jgi:hypothetical protein
MPHLYSENNVGTTARPSFVSFLCCFCLHITEYEQIMGGAQNFLGPRGVKYLNTGLGVNDIIRIVSLLVVS